MSDYLKRHRERLAELLGEHGVRQHSPLHLALDELIGRVAEDAYRDGWDGARMEFDTEGI